jgi:hypothetical protein
LRYPLFVPQWDFTIGDEEVACGYANTVAAALRAWGILAKPEGVPVLALPFPIVACVGDEDCYSVLISLRWHRALILPGQSRQQPHSRPRGPVGEWPPSESGLWLVIGQNEETRDIAKFDVETLRGMLVQIQQLKPIVLDASGPHTQVQQQNLRNLEGLARAIQQWMRNLDGNQLTKNHAKYRHDSARLLGCLRLIKCLKGGCASLVDVIEICIALALPEPFVQVFKQFWRDSPKPSASLCRHYELSLVVAMLLLQRTREPGKCVGFDWSDSSPQAGYDWLWSEFREIPTDCLIDLFEATVDM